jgi:hypothetical protein
MVHQEYGKIGLPVILEIVKVVGAVQHGRKELEVNILLMHE